MGMRFFFRLLLFSRGIQATRKSWHSATSRVEDDDQAAGGIQVTQRAKKEPLCSRRPGAPPTLRWDDVVVCNEDFLLFGNSDCSAGSDLHSIPGKNEASGQRNSVTMVGTPSQKNFGNIISTSEMFCGLNNVGSG
ncbi:hypothetical protein NPIL_454221 [Nephila pilipes]|uniref:Secreted protein n=1 Tax=Nephila pilipes TaxID=299642 RepID=A0A8X6MJM2_NEPPI|nr:hypothetical protein NPIL_454221 [Nephila pilipes]